MKATRIVPSAVLRDPRQERGQETACSSILLQWLCMSPIHPRRGSSSSHSGSKTQPRAAHRKVTHEVPYKGNKLDDSGKQRQNSAV